MLAARAAGEPWLALDATVAIEEKQNHWPEMTPLVQRWAWTSERLSDAPVESATDATVQEP
jgi:hypothetical protein